MRFTDMFIALPRIFMLIIMSLLIREMDAPLFTAYGNAGGIIIILGILSWTSVARVVRGQFLGLKEKEFVEAARTLGVGNMRIVFRHVLPNTSTPIIVAATLLVGATIIAESGLSFLGFGVIVPTPTWGNMLNSAQSEMLNGHWWMAVFPGLMIFLTVISVNYIGEGSARCAGPAEDQLSVLRVCDASCSRPLHIAGRLIGRQSYDWRHRIVPSAGETGVLEGGLRFNC